MSNSFLKVVLPDSRESKHRDIDSCQTTACRINEPVYKTNDNYTKSC